MFVWYTLGIHNGFTFSAGVIYFVVFYFSIKAFDIKTPGHEDEDASGPVGGGVILDEY